MKKRHEQKLVMITVILFFVLNIPFILIFNQTVHVFGIPLLYFGIFLFWLLSIIASYIILKKYYE
ncbi:hypothetical protein DNU06_07145 [Putridiphycobacter roseus]|uniref:DUF3311 domain-containing protein n=1 Tax=Putridiphycobacter roseus TaxID=2219161 RepID=A0A2W1N067_9FLAO|nr:hypothetical protein [Putridiphycobacter roseus]PZE17597.1 hypothetical protein DNU06_07145 [Putridiphycobacter roseus]